MKARSFWARRRVLVGIVLLSVLLHAWALLQLPLDADEPTYLVSAFDYASAIKIGDWNRVIDYSGNLEHPPLVKLTYALGIVALGKDANLSTALYTSRAISAVFGTLAVLVLSLFDPFAGAMFAVHTMVVKYTSEAYLEALPLFTAIVAVLAFWRSRKRAAGTSSPAGDAESRTGEESVAARNLGSIIRSTDRWFWLSAVALGLTAAGKYTYFPVLFVILYLAIWEKKFDWRQILLYLLAAAAVFWAFDPRLWRDPVARLSESLVYHVQYGQSAHVQASGYPWYQPFVWVSQSVPWHPNVFFYGGFDGLIFVLAVLGLWWSWQQQRWIGIWLVAGMIVLLLWPTKWPQYSLTVDPALCLGAAATIGWVRDWLAKDELYWPQLRDLIPRPPTAFWIVTGLFIAALTIFYIGNTILLIRGRQGWSHMDTQNSGLPGNAVHAMAPGPDGQMVLGTDHGVAIWTPSSSGEGKGTWTVYSTDHSVLPNNDVMAVTRDLSDTLWVGTETGLSHYDGRAWRTYHAQDLGLRQDRVLALAAERDGRLWVGTTTGVAVFDGHTRQTFTTATSGLVDDVVSSLAIMPQIGGGDLIWFGTNHGISRLDTATGEWKSYTPKDSGIGEAGIAHLAVDAEGRLWAATLGGGLSVWDGQAWKTYTTSNSDIPYNTVNYVAEFEPGLLWVATSLPNDVGGILATFDGQTWTSYIPSNSGFSGAEPLSIARDKTRRIWIGTRTRGVDLYLPPQ